MIKKTPKKLKHACISLKNVTKTYWLHHEKPTLSEQFLRRTKKEKFTALDDLSLKIYKGEKVGIIGRNGSGKTTLLKIIAGITTPDKGQISTKGRIVSLINLEAGFHPDLTGEENIYLNGMLLGMTRKEIEKKKKSIIEFADIHQFIDTPFFTYSEGMKLRLGFAVAVHADPDILILDEGVAAGDDNFQKKVRKKMDSFFKEGKTIVVVSHWLEFLEKNCKRIVMLHKSKLKMDGGKEILKKYRNMKELD